MIPNVGVAEILMLLTIVLLLFGAKRIPEFAKGLGSGVREFKKSVSGYDDRNGDTKHHDERSAELPEAEKEAHGEAEDSSQKASEQKASASR